MLHFRADVVEKSVEVAEAPSRAWSRQRRASARVRVDDLIDDRYGDALSINPRETNWDVVNEHAQTVMSPNQLGILRASRDQAQASAQAEDLVSGLVRMEAASCGTGVAVAAVIPRP